MKENLNQYHRGPTAWYFNLNFYTKHNYLTYIFVENNFPTTTPPAPGTTATLYRQPVYQDDFQFDRPDLFQFSIGVFVFETDQMLETSAAIFVDQEDVEVAEIVQDIKDEVRSTYV